MALTDNQTGFPGGPSPGDPNLPPGTYGQLRDSSGNVLNAIQFSYSQQELPTPVLPDPLPRPVSRAQGAVFSADSTAGGQSAGFRVLVENVPEPRQGARRRHPSQRDPADADAAADHRGRRVARRAGGARRGRLVADQARPAAARDHGRHRGRDRRRRPHAARAAGRAAHGGRTARPQPEHDARPHRGGVRGARRHRGEVAALPRRRLARATHPAHQHPRLLGGVRARQGRPREPRARDAPHRGGEQAHGRDGRGAAGAGAARRGPRAGARAGGPLARRGRRRQRRARRRAGARHHARARRDGRSAGRRPPARARSSPTC